MQQISTEGLLQKRREGVKEEGRAAASASGAWSPIFTHKSDTSIAAAHLGAWEQEGEEP